MDVKLATYMFDRLLNLPMDFFERTQTGRITHDMHEMWKIRTFLMGQLFGTVLDSTTLLVFIPIMFFFSPIMTLIVLANMCAYGALDRRDATDVPAQIASCRSGGNGARRFARADDSRHPYGQISRP